MCSNGRVGTMGRTLHLGGFFMKKYIVAAALAVVLSAITFASAQAVEATGSNIGSSAFRPATGEPDFDVLRVRADDIQRHAPARQDLIGLYQRNNNRFPAGTNFAAAGLTASEAQQFVLGVISAIKDRERLIAGLNASGVKEVNLGRVNLTALRFENINALTDFITHNQGKSGYRSAPIGRGDLLYAKPQELAVFANNHRAATADTCIHYCPGGGGAHNATCGTTCSPDPCAASATKVLGGHNCPAGTHWGKVPGMPDTKTCIPDK